MKLLWLLAGQNTARLEEIFRESRQSQRDTMLLPKEIDARTLPVGHSLVAIHRSIEMG